MPAKTRHSKLSCRKTATSFGWHLNDFLLTTAHKTNSFRHIRKNLISSWLIGPSENNKCHIEISQRQNTMKIQHHRKPLQITFKLLMTYSHLSPHKTNHTSIKPNPTWPPKETSLPYLAVQGTVTSAPFVAPSYYRAVVADCREGSGGRLRGNWGDPVALHGHSCCLLVIV